MPISASILLHRCQRVLAGTLIIAISLAQPAMLFGQGYFGTVGGVLTDATGAVVREAKVILTDQQKGFRFNATSDSNGRYSFRAIPPGLYSVSAEMQGFEKTVRTNIKVDVNATTLLCTPAQEIPS